MDKNNKIANPKQNATIAMKAWKHVKHMRSFVIINLKDVLQKELKEFSCSTWLWDSNLNLTVNHDNPLSTNGASARALNTRFMNVE